MLYITDIYLRDDYTEFITENFVKEYNVNLSNWILPFGYYDELNGSIISNGGLPDGCYLAVGTFSYPTNKGLSRHTIAQFNLCKSSGIDLVWLNTFNPYPDMPMSLKSAVRPIYPLFRIDNNSTFKRASKLVNYINSKPWALDELNQVIKNKPVKTLEGTIYRIRLALQRQLVKD